jgi:hypothetical protein
MAEVKPSTHIKNGHPKALNLLGVNHKVSVKISSFAIKPARARIGSIVAFSLNLKSTSNSKQKLVIDYRVHYVKAKASISIRTFKWAEKYIGKKETLLLSKQHSFKNMSTRKHYPGEHLIEVLINGNVTAKKSVRLT